MTGVLARLKETMDLRRAKGASLEIDPSLLTPHDNLRANVSVLNPKP